jgi:hypothetical protein
VLDKPELTTVLFRRELGDKFAALGSAVAIETPSLFRDYSKITVRACEGSFGDANMRLITAAVMPELL